jgi:hypothetical protein
MAGGQTRGRGIAKQWSIVCGLLQHIREEGSFTALGRTDFFQAMAFG